MRKICLVLSFFSIFNTGCSIQPGPLKEKPVKENGLPSVLPKMALCGKIFIYWGDLYALSPCR